MDFRIGHGYDVHALGDGLRLVLGGVDIPHSKGCIAHSDGDVLIHAICDAILGAAAMRDIGYHFPDNDNTYKAIDSKILLKRTVDLVAERGFKIGNIDSILCMQQPKLKPHIPEMQRVLAEVMGIDIDDVSVKATTTEKLGFEGREEGVSAYASVLLSVRPPQA